MFRKVVLSIISVLGLFSACVFSVGLGDIKQSTGLNQPLNAVIPLLSSGDLAEYEVLASLASNKEFNKVGVERLFFLNSLKFETTRDDNNQIVIKVTTRAPVKEPFLNFVVELNWPNGRILREYTLLLDPPIFENSTVSTIEKSTTKAPTPWASSQGKPAAESRAPRSSYQSQENTESTFTGSSYGPVSGTDTLWSISSRARPDSSVSIHQTLVAIYRANPDAFNDGNINNLRKGAILSIPDSNTIRDVPQRAALQDVVMQNRQWRSGGTRKIVDRSGDSGSSTDTESQGSRLSLATNNSEGDAQGYGSDSAALNEVRNELARTQEESATLQAENEALRARLADLVEKAENIQDESAVTVEDAELAALGQTLDSDRDSQINEEYSDEQDSFVDNTDELEESGNNETIDNGFTDNSENEEPSSLTASDEVATEQEITTELMPKAQTSEKSLLDQLMDNGVALWGGVAAVILFLMGLFWRMKKRMEDDDFQDDLVASTGSGSMDTTQTFELPDVGDDMLVELDMDNEDESDAENSDESFDPLGEADIYIAYGKHEQAETLLLEAIEDNPIRADLKVKLMECYAESDNQEKFEQLANEVSDSVDSAEWTSQINELRTQAWGESESASDSDDDFDLPSTEDIFGEEDDDLDVDFGNNLSETENTESDLSELDDIEDLDDLDDIEDLDDLDNIDGIDSLDEIDDLGEIDSDDSLDELDDIAEIDDDFSIDMDDELGVDIESDIDIDSGADTESDIAIAEEDDLGSLDDIGGDFDFEDDNDDEMNFEDDIGDEGDEIATKLDLARAYVDMGDADGAKEILREVIAEGNDEQKAEAQQLIDKAN